MLLRVLLYVEVGESLLNDVPRYVLRHFNTNVSTVQKGPVKLIGCLLRRNEVRQCDKRIPTILVNASIWTNGCRCGTCEQLFNFVGGNVRRNIANEARVSHRRR
jgi:hypothetical protein